MKWQTHSLRFRQLFSNGYRYLDRCGDFILEAVDRFDLLANEAKPTGISLSHPENGISVNADTTALEIVQEQPVDESVFLKMVHGLVEIAQETFGPLYVENDLFETKLLLPMKTPEEVEEASLKIPGFDQQEKSKGFGMSPHFQRVDTSFVSGSTSLRVIVTPTTFERVNVHRYNAALLATPSQIKRARRASALADRLPKFAPYALFLEVTVSEMDPPLLNLESLYKLSLDKIEVAKRLYSFQ